MISTVGSEMNCAQIAHSCGAGNFMFSVGVSCIVSIGFAASTSLGVIGGVGSTCDVIANGIL